MGQTTQVTKLKILNGKALKDSINGKLILETEVSENDLIISIRAGCFDFEVVDIHDKLGRLGLTVTFE